MTAMSSMIDIHPHVIATDTTRFPLAPPGGSYALSGTRCAFGPFGPVCSTYDNLELDANATPRHEAFRACMIEAGWLPARDEDDVAAITRSGCDGATRSVATATPSASARISAETETSRVTSSPWASSPAFSPRTDQSIG